MPRFFFDVHDHHGLEIRRDLRGHDLPDLESATIEATEIWKSFWGSGARDPLEWRVEVADALGTVLAKIGDLDFA